MNDACVLKQVEYLWGHQFAAVGFDCLYVGLRQINLTQKIGPIHLSVRYLKQNSELINDCQLQK